MLRSVFGEPTGTSVKFATMMHDAVQSYLEDHDVTSFNIQAIALEGEGQVDGRVDKLYAQLVARDAWVEALAKADVVFLAPPFLSLSGAQSIGSFLEGCDHGSARSESPMTKSTTWTGGRESNLRSWCRAKEEARGISRSPRRRLCTGPRGHRSTRTRACGARMWFKAPRTRTSTGRCTL